MNNNNKNNDSSDSINNSNCHHNASELITELLSITPTNEYDEQSRFVTVAEERNVRCRQYYIVTELLKMVHVQY